MFGNLRKARRRRPPSLNPKLYTWTRYLKLHTPTPGHDIQNPKTRYPNSYTFNCVS